MGVIWLIPKTNAAKIPRIHTSQRNPGAMTPATENSGQFCESTPPGASWFCVSNILQNACARHLAALALYALLAWVFIDHGISLTHMLLGQGRDPFAFMWFLSWWPYTFAHHLNPFYTHLVWQPAGLNISWLTSIPLLSCIIMPVTLLGGPVLAFNLLVLACPTLAGFAAYALCLFITRRYAAALIGGYLYGFSSYEIGHVCAHLNLDFAAFIPCLVLIALARLEGALSSRAATIGAALLLAAQFATSLELFATSALFSALTWMLAYQRYPARRAALAEIARIALSAGLLAALLVAPLLWGMFALPHDIGLPGYWPLFFSIDPLNLIIPTSFTLFGGLAASPIASHFTGQLDEQTGYLGLPLLLIVILQCRGHARFLGLVLALILIFSFGPRLWLAGIDTQIPLPWLLFSKLPFIGSALPARFMLFASLAAALAAALWVAAASPSRYGVRLIIGILVCISLLPGPLPREPIPNAAFFAPGRLQQILGPHPRLLIFPFGISGPSAYWQTENNFGFSQTGGYLGYPGASIQPDIPQMELFFGEDVSNFANFFPAFCARTGTQYVIAGPGTASHIMAQLNALHWPARAVDDVTIFTVRPPRG
jgi:hypothetical protein